MLGVVFHVPVALLLKQQQKKNAIVLCGCQYRACQNPGWLAGLKPPDGGGTVCVCVFSFFLVSFAFGKS